MREIKFRVWHERYREFKYWGFFDAIFSSIPTGSQISIDECKLLSQQCTGLKDKSGKEIYEGDIFRVEEDGAEDGTDQIYYLVIVWVKEWCMFCALRVADEYFNYMNDGLKALDEPMFWTYTLEDTNDRRFYLCGNIYSNPELLK